jgi:hypothetical protein
MKDDRIRLADLFLATAWIGAGLALSRFTAGPGPLAFSLGCSMWVCFGAGIGTVLRRPIVGVLVAFIVVCVLVVFGLPPAQRT